MNFLEYDFFTAKPIDFGIMKTPVMISRDVVFNKKSFTRCGTDQQLSDLPQFHLNMSVIQQEMSTTTDVEAQHKTGSNMKAQDRNDSYVESAPVQSELVEL